MSSSLMLFPVTEHFTKSDHHSSFYLACGPETGPLIIFVHGWPELGHSWRHQLRCFAALGFRCVAPDMRGYGRSSIYSAHADYARRTQRPRHARFARPSRPRPRHLGWP